MSEGGKDLQRLLEKIYRERGFDFREYRQTMLTRRLARRLHARGADTYAKYACILDQDPTEYNRLFDDLTINVTSFFRDDIAFRALEEVVLPCLAGKGARNIRIWSAGCATGEEPYSIGILLLEMLGQEVCQWDVTILGTDIDARALGQAKEGRFSPRAVEGIRQAWLEKYFVCRADGFHIQPFLRQLVTFKEHNLVNDPPCHELDLVVCRNVLIYFEPTLQTRVLKGLHEVLKDGGFLLLGKAEALFGETKVLFDCLDSKAKLFRNRSRAKYGDSESISRVMVQL